MTVSRGRREARRREGGGVENPPVRPGSATRATVDQPDIRGSGTSGAGPPQDTEPSGADAVYERAFGSWPEAETVAPRGSRVCSIPGSRERVWWWIPHADSPSAVDWPSPFRHRPASDHRRAGVGNPRARAPQAATSAVPGVRAWSDPWWSACARASAQTKPASSRATAITAFWRPFRPASFR